MLRFDLACSFQRAPLAILGLVCACSGGAPPAKSPQSATPAGGASAGVPVTATPKTNGVVLPSPESVTMQQPGGDAPDRHAAALQRLLNEQWEPRSDRDEQLRIALPDAGNWKRVRYFGVEHFVGFRYGQDYHAMAVVFVLDVEEERPSSEDCLRHFDAWGRPQTQPFDVDFEPFKPHHSKFQGRSLITLAVDGQLSLGFSRPKFAAAWAAYPAYAKACLISAVAVPERDAPELAKQVRDRFVAEGFAKLEPLTETRPYRK
ncbi:MAG TPA: hypothetical protein VFQ61_06815 [Polyangiaceae bacterium]|nr:hypothetical protein [Polyangiaceae bacterium]